MKTIRNLGLSALVIGALAPATVLADWDEERIKRDHPQALAETTVTGAAAGDTTRTKTTQSKTDDLGSNAHNDRIWAELVRKQSEAP